MGGTHLSDEQFAEALAGATSDVAAMHLAECAMCRAELKRVRGALHLAAAWSRNQAARPAGFWYAQRQAIAEQLAGRREPSRLVAWTGAMAAMVLCALLLTQFSATGVSGTQAGESPQPAREAADPDDALMAEIQASLRRPVPRPLEPALLVTQELSRAAELAEAQP